MAEELRKFGTLSVDIDALNDLAAGRIDPTEASKIRVELGISDDDVDAWRTSQEIKSKDEKLSNQIENSIFLKLAEKRPLDKTEGFPTVERFAVKNLAEGSSPKVLKSFLEDRGFLARIEDGKVQIADPTVKDRPLQFRDVEADVDFSWNNLSSWMKESLQDVTTDIAREISEAIVTGVGSIKPIAVGTALGGPVGGAAAGAASAGVLTGLVDVARQAAAQEVGLRPQGISIPEALQTGAEAGLIGGALSGAGAAARGIGTGIGRLLGRTPLGRLRPGAQETIEATRRLGARVTPAQVAESQAIQKAEEALVKGAEPSIGGVFSQLPKIVQKNKRIATETADDIVKNRSFIEKFQAGERVGTELKREASAKLEPAIEIYQKYEEAFKDIKPDTTSLKELLTELADEFKFDDEAARVIKNQLGKVDEIANLDDLKKFRTATGKLLRDQKATRAAKQVYDEATQLRSKTLIDAAEFEADSLAKAGAVDQSSALLKARDEIIEADRIYAQTSNEVKNAVLGRKKPKGGPKETLQSLLDKKEVDRINAILDADDPRRIAQIKKAFPDTFEILRQQKIEDIAKRAEINGEINPKRLAKMLNAMPTRSRVLLLGTDSAKKLRDLTTYLDSIPTPFNSSNTSNMAEFRSWLAPLRGFGRFLMNEIMLETQLGQSLLQGAGRALQEPRTLGLAVGARESIIPEEFRRALTIPEERRRDQGLTVPRGQ